MFVPLSYYLHPQFGCDFVRLQTWFPSRSRSMSMAGVLERPNGSRRAELSPQRQASFSGWKTGRVRRSYSIKQLATSWPTVLDELRQAVHPLHPGQSGELPVAYNWTVFQSEWARRGPSASRHGIWNGSMIRWVRHAFLNFDMPRCCVFWVAASPAGKRAAGAFGCGTAFEGTRLKHWVEHSNSAQTDATS